MKTGRRAFLGGMAGLAATGCRGFRLACGGRRLGFGVVSDIHVTTRESAAAFVKALRYFDTRGADAVMVCGDITDWGTLKSLEYVAEAWNAVFPGNRAAAGREVIPLFCSGNHDYEGWCYGDMKRELNANGFSSDSVLVRMDGGLKAVWEKTFGEPYAPMRVRTVKGYDFVCAEWEACDPGSVRDRRKTDPFAPTPEMWFGEHGRRFRNGRPFFYFQHPPVEGTTADSVIRGDNDGGLAFAALKDFPNAIAFTGHCHRPFCDERSVWQGAFTAVAVPSLSYACFPEGHVNGSSRRDGRDTETMPAIGSRQDLRGGQGYFVSVYDGCTDVERVDLEENGEQDLPAWSIPHVPGERPYAFAARSSAARAPEFPAGAVLEVSTRNTETRQGKWAIVWHLAFPSAVPEEGTRVFDYEVRVRPLDGAPGFVRRFLSPAYAKLSRYEPVEQRFWLNADDMPKRIPYVFEVRPRDCWGHCGAPLVSGAKCGY